MEVVNMAQQSSLKGLQLVPSIPTRVWERQPKETPEAYEAWQVYIAVRQANSGGINEVARRLGKSNTIIARWSSRWNWVERYRAYENNELLELERSKQQALRKEASVWAERRLSIREKGFELGDALIARAKNLLRLPVFDKEVTETREYFDKDGNPVQVEVVQQLNFQQHPRDARLMAETGIRLLRLSADMSTDNIAVPTDLDLEGMSDEELDAYVDKMLSMRQQVLGGEPEKTK